MRWVIILAAATALAAAPAAILPGPWAKWLNEDVVYIISSQERGAFGRLHSDADRQLFVEQFWKRRDPTPDTLENEFKEEHYRRIAYANDHFGSQIPGWKTYRGRVDVRLGAADQITSRVSGDSDHLYASEDWHYRQINGVGANVVIQFIGELRTMNIGSAPSPKKS